MISILNSISSGELQVQPAPEVKPVKEDSIIDLLQNSEIEFNVCPKQEEPNFNPIEFEIEFETKVEESPIENSKEPINIEQILQNTQLHCSHTDTTEQFNTGFGENHDLYYEAICKKPDLKTPLYLENYLSEFVSEEEKAAARHALGLYNKGDVVAMSLLSAESGLPSNQDWLDAISLQMKKGDKFFTPITSFNAVFDEDGNTLTKLAATLNKVILEQQNEINNINKVSNSSSITSLGDVRVFLQGFSNGDNLHTTIDNINKDMLRFETVY